ncbi:hypothetical protein [Bacillus albus]|uniref:hypothetical protein n=1 Tax=Bacillus albus TaxID=2026189 RepID=UPI00256FBC16|nr:hypothetical protein [Bacillus albus]WJE69353.1 hypothetical protein QRY64_21875 [Bacillus albus]HDR7432659.1 hypothetical protein [Bacillus anthracis]
MARYFYSYRLNTADQPDLFLCNEGLLKLDVVQEKMLENRVPINHNGDVEGEGYHDIEIIQVGNEHALQAFCLTTTSLGYYNEARFTQGTFTTERKQYSYPTKSKVYVTTENQVIIMFENSLEEKAKVKVKAQIESLGFETTALQINDALIRAIKTNFTWRAATFNKIVKHGDSTKKVSFEIDPANDTDPSQIDQQYGEHGEMAHIKFEMPYSVEGAPTLVTVTVYSNGNRIIVDENEFGNDQLFNDFVVYLIKKLGEIV